MSELLLLPSILALNSNLNIIGIDIGLLVGNILGLFSMVLIVFNIQI